MEQRARRKDQTSKPKAKAKSRERARASSEPPADQQGILKPDHIRSHRFHTEIRAEKSSSILRRVGTWLKRSALFPWLRDAAVTLQQSIMGNRSWPVVLVQIGLWVLLLWLLSYLHMGVPCFLLVLVYWLYNTVTEGRGPAPEHLHQLGVGEAWENNLSPP